MFYRVNARVALKPSSGVSQQHCAKPPTTPFMQALRPLSRPTFAPFRVVTRAMGVDVQQIKPGDGSNYPKKGTPPGL